MNEERKGSTGGLQVTTWATLVVCMLQRRVLAVASCLFVGCVGTIETHGLDSDTHRQAGDDTAVGDSRAPGDDTLVGDSRTPGDDTLLLAGDPHTRGDDALAGDPHTRGDDRIGGGDNHITAGDSWLAATSFEERCADSNVIVCQGFDGAIPEIVPDNRNLDEGVFGGNVPRLDTTHRASGAGSLRFTFESRSGAGGAGQYWRNFGHFGEGEQFFVQWRQYFSQSFLETDFAVTSGSGGWKQIIVGEGPWLFPDGSLEEQRYSCEQDVHMVVQNVWLRDFAQMYEGCGRYEPIDEFLGYDEYGNTNIDFQPGGPGEACERSLVIQQLPNPGCVTYHADEWMTFQLHVAIGTWGEPDSTVELWVAREGQPSTLALSVANQRLYNQYPGKAFYGRVWLLPYITNKDATQAHPAVSTWIDELIVSTRQIPDAQ